MMISPEQTIENPARGCVSGCIGGFVIWILIALFALLLTEFCGQSAVELTDQVIP